MGVNGGNFLKQNPPNKNKNMTKTLKNTIKTKYPKAKILKVGKWNWIFFSGKPNKEIRKAMKAEKGFWNNKRGCWMFSNGHRSLNSRAGNKVLFIKYRAKEEEIIASTK